MRLTGYSDRWSVRPGESIAFHVHSTAGRYDARLVRLIHGDENPRGPGFKEIELDSALDGNHAGATRTIRKGSWARVVLPEGSVPDAAAWTLSVWVWPTLPGPTDQGLLVTGPLALLLTAEGRVVLRAGGAAAECSLPLDRREWHHVTGSVDRRSGALRLTVRRLRFAPAWCQPVTASAVAGDPTRLQPSGEVLLAAAERLDTADGPQARGLFNGKLAAPCLHVLDQPEAFAAWDLGRAAGTSRILDRGPHGLHGTAMNRPTRLMTGPNWTGDHAAPAAAPEEWNAIHFHDDDVGDVGWPVSHRLVVPDDLPSGVYALRLRDATGAEDHLPFFVRPEAGRAGAKLALLMPTLSYLAYADESLDVADTVQLAPLQDMGLDPEVYAWIAANGLKSTYETHRDGSGICMGSLRRPILNFRPKSRCRTFDAPHQFPADLHLVGWLESQGIAFDVLTDHDLHADGEAALAPYRVVLTGSHPEYWTSVMLDARDRWLSGGGRLMYLGGNGFYWVTAVAEDDPSVMEIRRYRGSRTWQGEPGEDALSLTGEIGGLWRDRGRAPQRALGVGFTGQGFDRGAPFRRTAASRDPAWAWVFDGVEDEIVGAGPSLVLNHGAAGFEVDKADAALGTPAHAVVLASSLPLSDAYQFVVEETLSQTPWSGGRSEPRLGADILVVEHAKGGAVFTTGSIVWSATLFAGGDTATITRNVIDRFLAEDWRQALRPSPSRR